jgi:two-component system sensor histidine kinase TctE
MLLGRLLPALLLLLMAGAALAYWVAWRSATKAYDRALYDTALAIAEQVRVVAGKPQLQLTPQARAVLLVDKYDRIFYAVRGAQDESLDGDGGLHLPDGSDRQVFESEGRAYYDVRLGDEAIRVAALRWDVAGQPLMILAGETMVKRNALVREILFGMLLPELLLIVVSISVVWFGVRSGLRPLAVLRRELSERSPADLRPVRVAAPQEVESVVGGINELLARLEQALGAQRNFVADAAHQLRTPIAALRAQIDAAIAEAPGGPAPALAGVMAAALRLSRLVDQMLALARAGPDASLVTDRVSLPALAEAAADAWLPKAIARNVDLGFELEPAVVSGNALLLEELLANLLDNALRHAPDAGSVTVACGQTDGNAWISVEDSGPGIPASERERVFERFYQPPGTGGGNGLGLAIVREIARQHGGSVSAARSQRLGGARLHATFPAAGAGA